ncbi:MAG TPA: hypothetical protein VFM45_08925 [Anaeromyxobacteraceae bacterium]|nr:hypothetical protein [Anaeromyxobacteraceae bacterium]
MRTFLAALGLCLGLAACGAGSDGGNHVVTIQNDGTNTVQCVARQFTRLTLTPSAGGAARAYDFVCSPYASVEVHVTLPETGTYRLRLETPAGAGIWWDGLAMAVGGTTTVAVSTNNVGFYDNSYAAGLRSTGNDIPCQ